MTARYAVTETVIAEHAIVRLKKESAPSLKDLMARWRVLSVDEDLVRVEDVEDAEDTRTFLLEELERVSGGAEKIVGYAEVKCMYPYPEGSRGRDDFEYPSLFDDPEAIDEDEEGDEEDDEDLA